MIVPGHVQVLIICFLFITCISISIVSGCSSSSSSSSLSNFDLILFQGKLCECFNFYEIDSDPFNLCIHDLRYFFDEFSVSDSGYIFERELNNFRTHKKLINAPEFTSLKTQIDLDASLETYKLLSAIESNNSLYESFDTCYYSAYFFTNDLKGLQRCLKDSVISVEIDFENIAKVDLDELFQAIDTIRRFYSLPQDNKATAFKEYRYDNFMYKTPAQLLNGVRLEFVDLPALYREFLVTQDRSHFNRSLVNKMLCYGYKKWEIEPESMFQAIKSLEICTLYLSMRKGGLVLGEEDKVALMNAYNQNDSLFGLEYVPTDQAVDETLKNIDSGIKRKDRCAAVLESCLNTHDTFEAIRECILKEKDSFLRFSYIDQFDLDQIREFYAILTGKH